MKANMNRVPLPEFSRPISISLAKVNPYKDNITATNEECVAVANRLGIEGIKSLSCRMEITSVDGVSFICKGNLEAVLQRTCVISLDVFDQSHQDTFTIRLVPTALKKNLLHNLNDFEAIDDVYYSNGRIDLGEITVEQLALTMTPWPKKPGISLEEILLSHNNEKHISNENMDKQITCDSSPFVALLNQRGKK